ncbi:mercuric ion transport protein [Povalibacter uvarum]|uniref:Mercuric transport protein MerT n=1 Tax=Povalibacter uvarum TaxID=732238 RepID=A0A841HQS6_9GAMM|nr:mercuric transporter MerT family protein [Povalibacter uvarum]MBB6094994.1 mercuric ion transport protein [Povalibacter uvarum]
MSRELAPDAATTVALGRCGATRSAARWTTLGGILAALGVCSACCLLPAVLIALGLTGTWVGWLDSLAPYKLYFLAGTIVLLGASFYLIYLRRSTCTVSPACSTCRPSPTVRIGLWIGVLLVVAGLIFEAIEPLLEGAP